MERLLFIKKFTLYFRRLILFLWSIVIVLLLQQVHCQKPPVYTAESCRNKSVFCFFLQSQNKLRSLYGKVFPSVFIAQTSLLRRSVCTKNLSHAIYFPVHTSHSVNKSLILPTDIFMLQIHQIYQRCMMPLAKSGGHGMKIYFELITCCMYNARHAFIFEI